MAGDWIKMRVDLFDDPAVILIASTLNIDEDTVVGKLHRLWSWADRHTTDGNATSVSENWIDRYLNSPGFAKTMQKCGWLVISDDGVRFPEFTKHNGKTAKQRALTAKRVASLPKKTNADTNAASVSDALAREEKRREEKKEDESTNVDSRSEPDSPGSEPPVDPIVFTFPTKGKNPKTWHLRQSKIDEYVESFPAVEVLSELRIALQWCRDNPLKQKTATGMAAFLSNWLSRQQNKPRQNYQRPPSTPPTADKILAPEVAPLTDDQRRMLDQIFERQRREHERKGLSPDGPVPTA